MSFESSAEAFFISPLLFRSARRFVLKLSKSFVSVSRTFAVTSSSSLDSSTEGDACSLLIQLFVPLVNGNPILLYELEDDDRDLLIWWTFKYSSGKLIPFHKMHRYLSYRQQGTSNLDILEYVSQISREKSIVCDHSFLILGNLWYVLFFLCLFFVPFQKNAGSFVLHQIKYPPL